MKKAEFFRLLWERTQERGEFPALKRALHAIVSSMHDDMASTNELAAIVLGDFTLSQKVLRLANSAMYAPYGRDVTTVSRALMILGSRTVAHIAMGIQLIETFEGIAESRGEAASELAQASFAGKLAREFATKGGEAFGEEAAVATLMYQLSRLLVIFYLPEEWERIRARIERGVSEEDAFLDVVGVTPDEVSEAAVKEWTLPHQVIHKSAARPKAGGALAATHAEWLACIAGLSTELSQDFGRVGHKSRTRAIVERYAPTLGQDPDELERLAVELFAVERTPHEVLGEAAQPRHMEGKPLDAEKRLDKALTEVQMAASDADVSTLTQMVLESMMQGLGLVGCTAFFRSAQRGMFEARFGFGGGVKNNLQRMAFEEAFVPDVFHLALSRGRPIYLDDIQDAKITQRIPEWHKRVFPGVHSAVLLPIIVKDRAIGLLYGNWGTRPCSAGVSPRELEYLASMRDLVVTAFEEVGRHADRKVYSIA